MCNDKGEVFCLFFKGVGVRDSNEAGVLAILEALRIFSRLLQGSLIVESDSFNAISWVSINISKPWKLQFAFNEIKVWLLLLVPLFFMFLGRLNRFADALAKQGVTRVIPWEAIMPKYRYSYGN